MQNYLKRDDHKVLWITNGLSEKNWIFLVYGTCKKMNIRQEKKKKLQFFSFKIYHQKTAKMEFKMVWGFQQCVCSYVFT